MINENPIPSLVARYRILKRQADDLKAKMDDLKAKLTPLVADAGGKWQDDDGSARIIERGPSESYDANAIAKLANAWSISEDPIMKSCGEMVLQCRKTKDGYTYLQIK